MQMYAASAGKSGGEYFTPQEVSELLAQIATQNNDNIRSVYDPCCGSGIFLLKVKDATLEQLFGIDDDPLAVMIAKANLMVKFHLQKGGSFFRI